MTHLLALVQVGAGLRNPEASSFVLSQVSLKIPRI